MATSHDYMTTRTHDCSLLVGCFVCLLGDKRDKAYNQQQGGTNPATVSFPFPRFNTLYGPTALDLLESFDSREIFSSYVELRRQFVKLRRSVQMNLQMSNV